MAKRSNVPVYSDYTVDKEEPIYEEKPTIVNKTKASYTLVRNLVDARVKATGVSGREYVWSGVADVVEVASEDVEGLLAKRRGGNCCGGKPSPMFEKAQ